MKSFAGVGALAGLLLFAGVPDFAGAAGAASIEGLWAYESEFSTGPEGELTITRLDGLWRARMAGTGGEATAEGGRFRIDFPEDGGTLRGYLDAAGNLERAYWARREILEDPRYPEGAAQAYAMPLALRPAGADRWEAVVKPLADPVRFYLDIFRDEAGALKAAIRNPEHHRYGPAMQLFAALDGDRLRLGAAEAPAEDDLVATLRQDPERIELWWEGLRRRLSFTRATPVQAAHYGARPRGEPRYVYRMPRETGDGWPIARARDLGVDEAALARAVQRIIDINPSANRAWLIHSMAIAYKGRLILDEYFYGHDESMPHDMRSASKTFSSVILGAVTEEGAKISPRTKIYDVMAPLGPFGNPDPRKERITLAHVLTHTTGLACDDNAGSPSPGGEDVMQSQRAQPDWWKFTLDLPAVHEPGTRYAYCSGGISLAGGALTYATGEWLPALFDRTIARPLEFRDWYWNLMANGEGYVGGGTFVRTRDFLKVGQAYLDGGRWKGRRIASEAWVREAWAPQVQISPETTGVSGDRFAQAYYEVPEGFAWHHIKVKSGDRTYDARHGNGNGGQLLLVVPEFDLVAMFTAGNYRQGLWNRERDDIVGEMILPALPR
ncbi:MAG TPA: serine hydrolase [Steroidobacteraceae bacterium]|nr:serine hydrolase [Steroidobacteraceae bacterium]